MAWVASLPANEAIVRGPSVPLPELRNGLPEKERRIENEERERERERR